MKKLVVALIVALIFLGAQPALAAEFSLRPGSGQVKTGSNFTIDILIDSEGEDILLARSVLTFDPTLAKVVKAERNDSLFCDYPEDEQSVDNTNGVVMLTGFCQSGVLELYTTEGEPDVFARIEFEALKESSIVFEWEYTGSDGPFKTVIMRDGSPPINVLDQIPASGVYTGVASVTTNQPPANVPSTGLGVSMWMIAGGVLLLVLGFIFTKYRDMIFAPKIKGRTVVVYEKETK